MKDASMISLKCASAFRLSPYANARLFSKRQAKQSAATIYRKGEVPASSLMQRKQNVEGDLLSYSIAYSSNYGSILIASTSKGISAILIGGSSLDDLGLQKDLKRRFAHFQIRRDDESLKIQSIIHYLDTAEHDSSLSNVDLDLQGTPFQRLVWKNLREIPAGSTETYQQLTRRAGLPSSSVRAVANACGQNHVALLVPCHRIVRSDGGMGGYYWGTEIKSQLLRKERERAGTS